MVGSRLSLYCGPNTESVNFKVDTGADANVLPLNQARSLSASIISSEARLRSFFGDLLPSGGKTSLCLDKNGATKLEFELVDAQVVPIVGLKACVELGIVKKIDNQAILDEFADCFEGIGCFKREHTIQVDPQVRTVINRARRIPSSRIEKVKAELKKWKLTV